MSDFLFKEFDEVSLKQWKQKIQFDLKGLDYNDTLIWNTTEGIDVKPVYHKDELTKTIPNLKTTKGWNVTQHIFVVNEKRSNKNAVDVIERGAEAIIFELTQSKIDFSALLKGIDTSNTTIYFKLQFIDTDVIKSINQLASPTSKIYLQIDPIGNVAKGGKWFENSTVDLEKLTSCIESHGNLKSVLAINSDLYHNAGASIVRQLAYTLAHLNEYFNYLEQHSRASLKNLCVTINTAIGNNYFFELAKLRALRFLFDQLSGAYDIDISCHIISTPGKRNKTLYDYNVNMLRTTTECMSAVLGGADAVSNLPYDTLYHKNNEFGDRIARNQLLILKSESYFDKVENPADGAYFIESISQQLAEKALDVFKKIESAGGFLQQLQEGVIQRKIRESATKQQELFDTEKEVLIGTNTYPNKEDRMKNDLELHPFVKNKPRKTVIEPIIERRLAEKIEQERLANEQ
ncbi:methylmalonyl-CoA mutase subunit beta [Spongiivirga citrea]|uniref:Methylmalonyl-CoA mutase n=1 Tax=Spongiivirga citrea TaxID=1481457 RepID=A0A6M0CCW0_9FLAO|nr:methylmalonyl-CoA mutase subunit beta [Spongiivirga citrea]NER15668.1 methylmalonyl-CoA mutase [Spongiivirga citrea]